MKNNNNNNNNLLYIFGFALGTIVMIAVRVISKTWCPIDFCQMFYPAATNMSYPYSTPGFVSVPWVAFIMWPFAIFGRVAGSWILGLVNIIIIVVLLNKKQGGLAAAVIIFTSHPFVQLMESGNLDFVPMLAYMYQWPFLLLVKPQDGIFVALKWFRSMKGIEQLAITLSLCTFSLILWANWPALMLENIFAMNDSNIFLVSGVSIWPFSLIVSVALIIVGYIKRSDILLIAASWFFFPHLYSQSILLGLILIACKKPWVAASISLVVWAIAVGMALW